MEHLTIEQLIKYYKTIEPNDEKYQYYSFMKNIDKRGIVRSDMSPCWRWINKSFSSNGYGQLRVKGKEWNAHRYSYYLHNNCVEIEKGKHICHRCDNKECSNPEHLYIGSPTENAKDVWNRGIKVRKHIKKEKQETPEHLKIHCFSSEMMAGENNIKAKLTWDKVREIRRRAIEEKKYGLLKQLASEYDVAYITIQKIVANKLWIE